MAKHSVLFIPGSYVVLSVHQSLIDAVSAAGYEIKGIYLPSIGPCSSEGYPSPAPSMYDDVAAIADEAEQLADQGTDVVLTGHSYAGVPMSQYTKGLSRVERQQQGKPDPKATAAMDCQDPPAADGETLVRGFAKHSATSSPTPAIATFRCHLLCERDVAGPLDFQREMIAMIEQASGGRKVDATGIDAGHCANASKEKETNEWIWGVLRKTQGP